MRRLVLFVLVLAALMLGGWTRAGDDTKLAGFWDGPKTAQAAQPLSMVYADGGGGGSSGPAFECTQAHYGDWTTIYGCWFWCARPGTDSPWEGPYDSYHGTRL